MAAYLILRLVCRAILIGRCLAMNSVNRLSRIDALKESQDVSSSQDCAIAMLASGYQSHTPVQGLAHRRDFNHRSRKFETALISSGSQWANRY
ncbi:hypothetical protein PtB15_15B464 [Puccinia triticina]|nr:hypothetical protein PtB15_15B464 [Puccinia triticina]